MPLFMGRERERLTGFWKEKTRVTHTKMQGVNRKQGGGTFSLPKSGGLVDSIRGLLLLALADCGEVECCFGLWLAFIPD